VTCASKSLAEGGALQELSHLILSAGLTLAVVAREKASPLDGRTRVRFTPVSGRLAAKSWSLLCADFVAEVGNQRADAAVAIFLKRPVSTRPMEAAALMQWH
jgi:hypothetical protein